MSVELKTWGSRISNLGRSMMIAGAAGASLFIKPIMEALQAVGYDQYVSLEPFQWQPDAHTIAAVSLKYLKAFLK
jgi:sugar phosphate isomerase/epimerase